MKKSIYKNYDELPLFLNAKIIAAAILPIKEAREEFYRRQMLKLEFNFKNKNKANFEEKNKAV